MSHSAYIKLIADQEVIILGDTVNIHDIESITIDGSGKIIDYYLKVEVLCQICFMHDGKHLSWCKNKDKKWNL